MNTRRQFVRNSVLLGAALAAGPAFTQTAPVPVPAAAKPPRPRPAYPKPQFPEHDPQLDAEMVKAFVIAAHGDLELTRRMLAVEPMLINATWEWGAGDFETALGGASHMGRRDIALALLEQGARLDLFAATMLGRLDLVRATLETFPYMFKTPGPHGIPLLVHAQHGGTEAADVLAYLQDFKARAG